MSLKSQRENITLVPHDLPVELYVIVSLAQMFYLHISGHRIIPFLLALFSLCLCWSFNCVKVNFSKVLQPSNDFIAGCFMPASKPAAWGRFSVLPLLGSEL